MAIAGSSRQKRPDCSDSPHNSSSMCVRTIVDASAFRHICEPTRNSAGDQVRGWIDRGDGRIVYSIDSTRYAEELERNRVFRAILRRYVQRGLAMEIGTESVQAAVHEIPGHPIRQSDDPHVLALALASEATVLFSCDRPLQKDFANHRVLCNVGGHPRRSVPDVRIGLPRDTSRAANRRKFLERRKCPFSD